MINFKRQHYRNINLTRSINVSLINNFNFVVLKEQGATTKEGNKRGHQEALTYLENRRQYAVI